MEYIYIGRYFYSKSNHNVFDTEEKCTYIFSEEVLKMLLYVGLEIKHVEFKFDKLIVDSNEDIQDSIREFMLYEKMIGNNDSYEIGGSLVYLDKEGLITLGGNECVSWHHYGKDKYVKMYVEFFIESMDLFIADALDDAIELENEDNEESKYRFVLTGGNGLVTLAGAFSYCAKFKEFDISGATLDKVTDVRYLFAGTEGIEKLTGFDVLKSNKVIIFTDEDEYEMDMNIRSGSTYLESELDDVIIKEKDREFKGNRNYIYNNYLYRRV